MDQTSFSSEREQSSQAAVPSSVATQSSVVLRWGVLPPQDRQDKLMQQLKEWNQESDHGERSGPFAGIALTGADVFWLAANVAGRGDITTGIQRLPYFGSGAILSGISGTIFSPTLQLPLLQLPLQGANLDHAQLQGARLTGAQLQGTHLVGAQLQGAYLSYAQLQGAWLTGAQLQDATLSMAKLQGALLVLAHLERTKLYGVQLQGADMHLSHLEGADLEGANFEGVNLRNVMMDINTELAEVKLDRKILVADVIWNSAPLTRIDWDCVPLLGDEDHARRQKWPNLFRQFHRAFKEVQQLPETSSDINVKIKLISGLRLQFKNEMSEYIRLYSNAVRANRQLALALQEQGLIEEAERFEYRAQNLQREVFRRQRKIAKYLFSCFLALLTGYGYRLWRIIITYILINLLFATVYWILHVQTPPPNSHVVNYWEALVTSLQVIHGRIFNPFGLALPDVRVIISSIEAIIGLVLEATLIAMLTQRFFRH